MIVFLVIKRSLKAEKELNYLGGKRWRVILVADLDKKSIVPDQAKCRSYVIQGNISISYDFTVASFEKGPENEIQIDCKMGSRGLELSDLVNFQNKLYTCDDKTGMVYKFNENFTSLQEVLKLNDGDGTIDDGSFIMTYLRNVSIIFTKLNIYFRI